MFMHCSDCVLQECGKGIVRMGFDDPIRDPPEGYTLQRAGSTRFGSNYTSMQSVLRMMFALEHLVVQVDTTVQNIERYQRKLASALSNRREHYIKRLKSAEASPYNLTSPALAKFPIIRVRLILIISVLCYCQHLAAFAF
jgi:hypothetical protein